jgi:ferredoxin
VRFVVDAVACAAHGLCAELVPELIALDDWGYPILLADVSPELEDLARRAVGACPTLALRLEPTVAAINGGGPGPRSRRRTG